MYLKIYIFMDSQIEIVFINSCVNNDIDEIVCILDNAEIDINIGIVHACRAGSIDAVKILLKKGADPNYIDKSQKNMTPIIAAMLGDNWTNSQINREIIVNELVNYGGIIHHWIYDYVNMYNSQLEIIKQSQYTNYELMKFIF